jgi:hypothetical protein
VKVKIFRVLSEDTPIFLTVFPRGPTDELSEECW